MRSLTEKQAIVGRQVYWNPKGIQGDCKGNEMPDNSRMFIVQDPQEHKIGDKSYGYYVKLWLLDSDPECKNNYYVMLKALTLDEKKRTIVVLSMSKEENDGDVIDIENDLLLEMDELGFDVNSISVTKHELPINTLASTASKVFVGYIENTMGRNERIVVSAIIPAKKNQLRKWFVECLQPHGLYLVDVVDGTVKLS